MCQFERGRIHSANSILNVCSDPDTPRKRGNQALDHTVLMHSPSVKKYKHRMEGELTDNKSSKDSNTISIPSDTEVGVHPLGVCSTSRVCIDYIYIFIFFVLPQIEEAIRDCVEDIDDLNSVSTSMIIQLLESSFAVADLSSKKTFIENILSGMGMKVTKTEVEKDDSGAVKTEKIPTPIHRPPSLGISIPSSCSSSSDDESPLAVIVKKKVKIS